MILLVNGPNLNLLGEREPEVYGRTTLARGRGARPRRLRGLGLEVKAFQSNHEGALIDFIQEHRKAARGIVVNPGALTHTSYALHDCLKAVPRVPVDRGAPLEHPRPRGVPAHERRRAGVPGPDRRARDARATCSPPSGSAPRSRGAGEREGAVKASPERAARRRIEPVRDAVARLRAAAAGAPRPRGRSPRYARD